MTALREPLPTPEPAVAAAPALQPRLGRNMALNLAGWAAAALLGLVAVPFLLRGFGTARFGLLTLAWSVAGYFGLLDLGLSRALAGLLAPRLGTGRDDEVSGLVWATMGMMLPVGLAGAATLYLLAPWLAHDLLVLPDALRAEAAQAFRVFAAAIPFTLMAAGLRAVLEAAQRFDRINQLRIPLALVTFVGPLLTLPFSPRLPPAIGVLAAGRALLFVAFLLAALGAVPAIARPRRLPRPLLRELARFGGWVMVANLATPMMVSLDRFVVGARLSVSEVAYYATSSEAATKLWLYTAALLPVLFPALAAARARSEREAGALLGWGARAVHLGLLPACVLLVAFAPEGLTLWLGAEFAERATWLFRALVAALLVNCVGQAAYVAVDAAGRADITGKLQGVQVPLYLGALWLALPRFGIAAIGVAWLVRMTLDAAANLVFARRLYPSAARALDRTGGAALLSLPLLALVSAGPLAVRGGLAVVVAGVAATYGWRQVAGRRPSLPGRTAEQRVASP